MAKRNDPKERVKYQKLYRDRRKVKKLCIMCKKPLEDLTKGPKMILVKCRDCRLKFKIYNALRPTRK